MTAAVGIDATRISNGHVRMAVAQAVKHVTPTTRVNFWQEAQVVDLTRVAPHRGHGPWIVACDMSVFVGAQDKLGVHKLVTLSRVHNVGFCIVVNTTTERRQMEKFDTVFHATDGRVIAVEVKQVLDRSAAPKIADFVNRLKPEALFDAKYSMQDGNLSLQFGDGKLCQIAWSSLPFSRRSPQLLPETAVAKENGGVLQVLDETGHEFDIDAEALRAICDPRVREKLRNEDRATKTQVGQLLQRHRLRAELTQDQLAEKTGIDQAVISRIEQGAQRPRIDTLQKIATALNLEISELLSAPP